MISLFLVFSLATGKMSFANAETCGCFGNLKISPVIMLAVDLGVLAVLLRQEFFQSHFRFAYAWAILAVPFCVAGVVVWTQIDEHRVANSPGSDTALSPPFQGTWLVLVYRDSCDKCTEMVDVLRVGGHRLDIGSILIVVRVGSNPPKNLPPWCHLKFVDKECCTDCPSPCLFTIGSRNANHLIPGGSTSL